eukprot:2890086-Pyramimonas_sp.AAC.1
MQQTDAPDVFESIPVITSPYSPRLVHKTNSTSEDESNNTNSFANLALAADRVQSADATDVSESIPVITSPAAPLELELSAENGQHLSR